MCVFFVFDNVEQHNYTILCFFKILPSWACFHSQPQWAPDKNGYPDFRTNFTFDVNLLFLSDIEYHKKEFYIVIIGLIHLFSGKTTG